MVTVTTPVPGDFGVTKISGLSGKAIAAGQALIGKPAPVQHALLYVGNGKVIQAQPGGAECIALKDANPVYRWSTGRVALTAYERILIVKAAYGLVGTPYSYADYLSIALAHWHIRPRVVRDYVSDTHHMICSQLVDYAYLTAGVRLFPDNRIPGDVTPADLWGLIR